MKNNYVVPFMPPAMPFEYTVVQAQAIYEYVELYYRKIDVMDVLEEEEKAYFINATDEAKDSILTIIADDAIDIISNYGCHWRDAIDTAIADYEENLKGRDKIA